jgi:hypothetical protein
MEKDEFFISSFSVFKLMSRDMKIINIILKSYILAVISIVSGCGRNSTVHKNMNYITIAVDAEKSLNGINMSEIFSAVEYIPLETGDNNLIGEINQIVIFKDRIYISDTYQTQSVFCYSMEGKFLYKLDKKGQGPDEYIKLNGIDIDRDKERLLIYSSENKILEYDMDGNFIESYKIDIWANSFSCTGNNRTIFYGDYTTNTQYEKKQKTPNLFVMEKNKVIHTDLYFPSKINIGALTSNFNCFSNNGNGTVSLLDAYNDTIYHVTADSVKRAYYLDFGKKKKGNDFYSLIHNPATTLKTVGQYQSDVDICNIIAISETADCLFFAYRHRNIYHYAFYYKNTGAIIDVCREYTANEIEPVFPVTDDISGIRFSIPYYTDGYSFYGYVEAYEIAGIKEKIINPELKKKFEKISEYDNPVIVKMTPKTD